MLAQSMPVSPSPTQKQRIFPLHGTPFALILAPSIIRKETSLFGEEELLQINQLVQYRPDQVKRDYPHIAR